MDGQMLATICYSRCLWCGRQTPHEVCHEHGSAAFEQSLGHTRIDTDALWTHGMVQEPETCTDFGCPLWEGRAPAHLSPMTVEEYRAIDTWRLASVGEG